MKIAVMGAGGVGAYFGARLTEANEEVTFIARGIHLDAMRRYGLRIKSVNGNVKLISPHVTDDPAEIGPVDIILFTVKLWDTKVASDIVKPLVGPETALISLQNGIFAEGILADRLGVPNSRCHRLDCDTCGFHHPCWICTNRDSGRHRSLPRLPRS